MARILAEHAQEVSAEWVGFEVRPPPMDPLDPDDVEWVPYQAQLEEYAQALSVPLTRPRFIPWTRKAHELTLFAEDKDCSRPVRDALFQAHFMQQMDIGRVDVLVEIATGLGLDRSETKAILDVDRYTSNVESNRALAQTLEIAGVPTLIHEERREDRRKDRRLEGIASPSDVIAWCNKD